MIFVTGLPRSRTAWFAAFLSSEGWHCHHELLARCLSRSQFYDAMRAPQTGNSDCGLYLTDFQDVFPQAPTLVIHRPVGDVADALSRLGIRPTEELQAHAEALRSMRGFHVEFRDIDAALPDICSYLGTPYCAARADLFKGMNIQRAVLEADPRALAVWRDA